MTQQTTAKKPNTKTVTKPVNKVNVVRVSQLMKDGSVKWNDEAREFLNEVDSVVGDIIADEILTDQQIQAKQMYYGSLIGRMADLEIQTSDKKGVFGKPKRISNNLLNTLIVEHFGKDWADIHKNRITAYRSVYAFTQAEDFEMFVESGYAKTVGLVVDSPRRITFYDKHERLITNFQDEKTGQYHSVKTLYTKFGFKVNKDGEPEKRVPNTSANGANKRKEEKPTSDKQKAELTLQSVKAFLNANGMKVTDRMEAITLFGNVLDRLAQHEAKKAK